MEMYYKDQRGIENIFKFYIQKNILKLMTYSFKNVQTN